MKLSRYSLLFSLLFLMGLQGFANAEDAKWLTNYKTALAQAKAENKPIFIDFTGSDWCPVCQVMDKQVLSTKEFKDYASKNLVLLELDFPQEKPQAEELKKQNQGLLAKYNSDQIFPTFVMVTADGKELGRHVGYLEGGPSAFIAKLSSFK